MIRFEIQLCCHRLKDRDEGRGQVRRTLLECSWTQLLSLLWVVTTIEKKIGFRVIVNTEPLGCFFLVGWKEGIYKEWDDQYVWKFEIGSQMWEGGLWRRAITRRRGMDFVFITVFYLWICWADQECGFRHTKLEIPGRHLNENIWMGMWIYEPQDESRGAGQSYKYTHAYIFTFPSQRCTIA